MVKFEWQGEPVKIEFGHCKVTKDEKHNLYWYNYDCDITNGHETAFIDAVKVTTRNGEEFCISNQNAYGVHKLRNGGWPNCGHASLPLEGFETNEPMGWKMRSWFENKEFDLVGYEKQESDRRNWQKKNFPIEFEKSDKIVRAMRKRRLSKL